MHSTSPTAEQSPPSGSDIKLSHHIWALLGYFALALVVTYPTIAHFTSVVPSELIPDRDQHYWNFWWITQAALRPTDPLRTDMLYYPYGTPLYYHVLAIPLWLIGLIPQLIWGYAAAYNTVVIAAFTLSGYGAYRLALLIAHRPLASFLGGFVFAFTPYTLGAVSDGQNEVFSLQWIPFYAEAWLRAWRIPGSYFGALRPLLLAGIFFALGAYTTLYYPVDFLLFSVLYIAYLLLVRPDPLATLRRGVLSLAVIGIIALVICAPLVKGLIENYNNPRLDIGAGEGQMIEHSADLLGLFAAPHDHPLLGGTRYGTEKLPVRDNLSLGYVALALAAIGAVNELAKPRSWRKNDTRFWVAFGIISLVLALGPELQIGRTLTGIPLPFKLLENLPIIQGLGKVERFIALTRLSMGVLAAWGSAWVLDRLARRLESGKRTTAAYRVLPAAFLLSLLLFELPLHPRYGQPFDVPAGFDKLAQQPAGGLMELPFATQQNDVVGERMVYQTVHNHPIMAGYLSRNYNSPIIDSCSPFWGFISPLDVPKEGEDIITPAVVARPLDVLNFYKIGYIALYSRYNKLDSAPLDPKQQVAYKSIISTVSHAPALSNDDFVTIYPVDHTDLTNAPASFHVGQGWYKIETSGGKPSRWIKDNHGTLCVFAPRPITATLVFDATAFAHERTLSLALADQPSSSSFFSARVSPQSATERTPPIEWKPGVTQVHISSPDPGQTPRSIDPNQQDDRALTLQIKGVHLEFGGQK
jgi:hypothetical protein